MDTFRISRAFLLTLLVACAPLAAQTPTVDTSTVTITYTGSASPNPQSVNVSNASNVSARISANIESDGSTLTSAGNTPGVFVQNVTKTSDTTASVNIGVDSNVLGALARRGATTYTGGQLLISANGCVDCVPVALNLSITNGGSVNVTYNGAPIPASGLQLSAPAFGSTSAQITVTSSNPAAFTASSNVTWLSVSPNSGNLQGSQVLTLQLFANGLPTGPNSATVTINVGGNTTTVPVVFNVGTSSGLTLSPNPMNFQYVTSTGSFTTTNPQYLSISGAASTATYSANASSSGSWLLVGSSGSTFVSGLSVFTQLPITVNTAALNLQVATTYQGTVTIQTTDGLVSTLIVNLTVSATGGTGTNSLTFNVASPGGVAPAAQQFSISGSGFFQAFASTSSCGQGWLQVSPTSGTLSSFATTLFVSVIPGSLSAGTCTGTISLSTSGGLFSNGTSSQTINVTMIIGGSTVSGPVASPTSLLFNVPSGSTQQQQQTFIVNGNGTAYSAQAFGNFNVSPTNGTTPAIVTVTVVPGTSSSGTIVVNSSLGSQNVTVTINTLTGNVLTATPGSLSLLSATSGTQNISINASQDSTGQHLTFSVVSAPSFVAYNAPTTTTPSTIGIGINAMQLAPGINTGNLVITSSGASNGTLTIPITVLAPGSASSGLVATPNPATLSGTPGGTAVTQTISISGLSGTSFYATASPANSWLSVTPSGTSPTTLTITASPANLAQNNYTGTVTLTSAITNATLLSIPVTFNVGTTGSTTLTVSPPGPLTFNYRTGDTAPTAQQISISTSTGTATSFTATPSANWIAVSPTSGSTPASLSISLNTAGLSLGTQTGTVTIAASGATSQTITVTANVTAPPVLTVNSSSASFSYRTGDPAPPSQSIQVNSTGAALAFTASVTNATWLSVTPTGGSTPATLTLTANPSGLTVGQYSASVVITASGSSQTVAVTLNVSAPLPTISEVHNGASNQPGPIAPGLIIVITGSAMGPDTLVPATVTGDLFPTTVSATRVLVGGFAAPIIYTSATQVSAIVPYEIAGRTSTFVQVEYLGQRSNAVTVTVANTAPAIFTLNMSGTGPGAILNQDGSVNSASNPESVNRSIVLFATGEGQTIPAGVDGKLADDPVLPKPVFPVTATISNLPAEVQYYGAAPGLVAGVMQVNLLVPAGATSGNVVISIGGNSSQNGVTVAIR